MKESKGQEIAPHRRKYEIMKFNPHKRKLVSFYIKFHAESLQFPVNKRNFFFFLIEHPTKSFDSMLKNKIPQKQRRRSEQKERHENICLWNIFAWTIFTNILNGIGTKERQEKRTKLFRFFWLKPSVPPTHSPGRLSINIKMTEILKSVSKKILKTLLKF